MHRYTLIGILLISGLLPGTLCFAQESQSESPSKFTQATKNMQRHSGFFDVFTDRQQGKLLALLPAPSDDGTSLRLIHAVRLAGGLGSNPLGLDRGWGNFGQLIRLRRVGSKLVAEVENHRYRATTDNPLERAAIAASFANSFIWSGDIIDSNPAGEILVDISSLLTSDLLNLASALEENGNSFQRSADRSLADTASVLTFPDNVELQAFITFTSSKPGTEVSATAANPNAVTLIQHHSFVRLPDDGYQTRTADPRTGTFAMGFYDFATDLAEPVLQGYAMRHRLRHTQPGNPDSPIQQPIVFYIDSGAPETIRNALIEGASWWTEAFAAAGFEDGFRVEVMPPDMHPLDIRNNVVQWVHRQTRGWSYGGGIIDPRTGEMIKGHVILGSQRVRQDRMIFEGLAGTDQTGTGQSDDPVQLALARIRQLAAHEVGHALGFGHNFAASVNNRASVMDYPAPWVTASDGELDFSRAYDSGIGAWDIHTAKWLYTEMPPGQDEDAVLQGFIDMAEADGLLYVEDSDARSIATGNPVGAVWDNGNDAIAELDNVMTVRRIALDNFTADRIRLGRRLSDLREVLTPIYLYHRYQLNAAAKYLGGLQFDYALRDPEIMPVNPVTAARQRQALDALLQTLNPESLDIPESILALLPPPHSSYWFPIGDETIASRAAPAFDLLAAAETAADLSFSALLNPQRAERVLQFHLRDPEQPGLAEVFEQIDDTVFTDTDSQLRLQAITQVIQVRYVAALMDLSDSNTSALVHSQTRAQLSGLRQQLLDNADRRANRNDRQANAHRRWLANRIQQHLNRPAPATPTSTDPLPAPPGSPIGSYETCWHCSGR